MNIGLIGCGGVANLHLKVYKTLKNVKIVGVCDLNLERAKSIADRFKIDKTYSNYNDLFEIKDLDMVDICTPISTHARVVCDAAKAVRAVLVEKPMALSVAQCDEMINEVNKHRSKLCISHQQIFLASIEKAKALIDSGQFDLVSFLTRQKESFEVLKAHGFASDWMVAPEQGGIIWEVCTHLMYLQLHFLNEIKEVYAVGGKFKYPVYDNFAVLMRTNDQRFGEIDLSWTSKETEVMYEMCDSKWRRAQIYRNFNYFVENNADSPYTPGGVMRNFFAEENRTLAKWATFGINYFKKDKMVPHAKLISKFLESVEKDTPSPVTAQDGRKTVAVLEAIKKSLDTHAPVTVESQN